MSAKIEKELSDFFDQPGVKHTSQREAIVQCFLKSKDHLSIEDLLAQSREIDPQISYATVYRTLNLLKDKGLAIQRNFGEGQSLFEKAGEHHDHLICVDCAKIIEFEEEEIEDLQKKLAKKLGFELIYHRHELYGRCASCKKK